MNVLKQMGAGAVVLALYSGQAMAHHEATSAINAQAVLLLGAAAGAVLAVKHLWYRD